MVTRTEPLPFRGIDGEGGNLNGSHEYLLLRAGDHTLYTGHPLSTWECLDFLSELPRDGIYVSYFFDYDVTMIMRGLPEERVRRLLDREGRTKDPAKGPMPVDWGPFQFDYLPHKELRVRKKGMSWRIFSDVGTFFQKAFLKTLKLWGVGTDSDLEQIATGKNLRASFGELTSETDKYNALEISLLEELMSQFRQTCEHVGYVPMVWQGPGNLASAIFRKHDIPKNEEFDFPDELWRYAQSAYYGGRFETTAVGPIAGPIKQWDINSAYPYACTLLPCLRHAKWRKTKAQSRLTGTYVAKVSFRHPDKRMLYSFPIRRDDGSIFFPQQGQGWYWSVEIDAARRAGATVVVHDAWVLDTHCTCQPFAMVNTLYTMRVSLGKNSALSVVLKLALNSLYGKLAQSVGAAPYANPIWAGLITAITRARLIDAYRGQEDKVFMLATDGIFTSDDFVLESGQGLGAWDLSEHPDGMFIIQPGLYRTGSEEGEHKTRGVPVGKIMRHMDCFERAWERGHGAVSVRIPLKQFISLRLAYARNNPASAGQWPRTPKVVSFDWSSKRHRVKVYHDRHGMRMEPYTDGGCTIPYRNLIGNLARNIERYEMNDVPDWAEGLVSLD